MTLSTYESNTTLAAIAAELDAAASVLITTHAKPDGDAIGSVVALARALLSRGGGKRVACCFMPPIGESFQPFIAGLEVYTHRQEDSGPPCPFEPERIVIVDTGAWSQLEPLHAWLAPRRERAIVIDHHLRGDDVAAMRFIDAEAAASAEIVAQLIHVMGVPLDLPIATALFMGVASDTGWFRFSNTRPCTHDLASRLMRVGVDHADLYIRLEQSERPQKLGLMTRALDSLELLAGGRAAVMTLRVRDFTETGARVDETERLVDLPQIIGPVQVVVLVTETETGPVRLSFRSKPGTGPNPGVDVNVLAQRFGGGGHARAAGAKVKAPLEATRRAVVEAVEQVMGGAGSGAREESAGTSPAAK